jgi:hypothetical protein
MIRSFRIEYDRDYGIDRRSGWTTTVNGIVCVELTSLLRAVFVAAREVIRRSGRRYDKALGEL